VNRIELRRKWHVVVDPGCGATFSLAPAILQDLGCGRVTALNAQPDGWFPARSSEPNAESLKQLARVVKVLGADIGVAYDGDGDRAAFIDEKGNFADFDQTLAAYAAYIVEKNDGGTVVTSVETSMSMEKMVEPLGGKVLRTKVGDIYIAETMKKRNALFGGEPCGAWIHPQFHYCPDGILSSVLILETLEDENKNLAEFVAAAPKYPMFRENFSCKNELKEKALREIGDGLKAVFAAHIEFSAVDGFRLVLQNGWLLVRPSGTEPTIRLTVEGESLKAAKQITQIGAKLIKKTLGNGGR
jgi:phosphoglucosamine mutase